MMLIYQPLHAALGWFGRMGKCLLCLAWLALSGCQSIPSGTNSPNSSNSSLSLSTEQKLAVIRTQIAEQLLSMGRLDDAKVQLDTALAYHAKYAPAYRIMAMVYQASAEPTHQQYANTLYQKAIAIDASDMQNYMDYGNYLAQMGDDAAAIRQFERPAMTIGYHGRLTAIENIAFVRYRQFNRQPTDDSHHQAKTALQRAIQAGSQSQELVQAYQLLLSYNN
ncbi:pilus assembly protein [Moraxella sp. ZJ142]|uniref:pilus assembly protein n=1 Tax=Moraxella marmotae TaxID=3344520 RepID=UPI0035D4CC23